MECNVFMKKNGIKNFIFSFFMSLLAVIVVNKAVFDAPENLKSDKKEKKSPIKSITLFSESKNNVITQNENTVKFDAIENLVADNINIDSSELPNLDINSTDTKIVYAPESTTVANIIKPAEDITHQHTNYIDISSASEIKLEEATPINLEPKIEKTAPSTVAEIVYADISDTLSDENKLQEQEETSRNIVLAQTEATPQEESFIPLTENNETIHNKIDVLTASEGNQIAMLEPNTLVSSIDSFDNEEKNLAEVNLKEEVVVSQSETSTTDTADSPWVVAQSNKFAKNKIAQINNIEDSKSVKAETETNIEPENTQEPSKENVITVHKEETVSDTDKKSDISESAYIYVVREWSSTGI